MGRVFTEDGERWGRGDPRADDYKVGIRCSCGCGIFPSFREQIEMWRPKQRLEDAKYWRGRGRGMMNEILQATIDDDYEKVDALLGEWGL